jgi:hypothetical protein
MFSVSFYLIPGVMLGAEMQKNPDTDASVFIIDLFIVRFMFERGDE